MVPRHPRIASLDDWLLARDASAAAVPADVLAFAQARPLTADVAADLAQTLVELDRLHADGDTLSAALLYVFGEAADAVCPKTASSLIDGQRQAEKVWSIYGERDPRSGTEGLRRLLLSIVRDLRVVLILLSRQIVRLRGAQRLPDDERRRLAQLAADIHAPLANRLGIWQLKWEMEDLVFRILHPDTYRRIAALLDEKRGDREGFIEQAKAQLRAALAQAGIRGDVAGRPKHIFSIWKKMQRKDVPFSELYDIRAVRVLVDDIASCYATLGLVHGLWSPVPSEFDDYIANPKGNNYRSLHTAVVGPHGKTLEIQIRTFEMHEHAELGVAAHWRYKEGGAGDAGFERKIAWMRQLLEGKDTEEDAALLAGLSTELIEDRIYVLTPQGQVIDLPRGGTVLDFAYHVHTEVGHRCRGAKVNGRIVPLNFAPKSGDRIEILTGKTAEPRRDWLLAHNGYLASARARDKVRAWFHKLDHARNVAAGREMLEKELKRLALHQADLEPVLAKLRLAKLEDLHVAVALGDVGPSQVARTLHETQQQSAEPARGPSQLAKPPKPASGFTIEGVGNLMVTLARCCQPVAGDAIVGYLTRGRGVTVHRDSCPALAQLTARAPERLLPVEWGGAQKQSYSVDVLVRAYDRKWLLKDLTNIIGAGNAHILAVNTRLDEARNAAELRFTLKVNDFEQLGELLSRMAALPGVSEVRRTP
ncbi:RelA/SpoT family protein [Chiayiivirga flava]|uniref:GTP pyrophosphokinase n=1 Tax=Chiayiivirga flava TaxID=659595 RepID=A0A7W8G0W3_9GAMM|nr:bifunctional (p)ppGpp synthetase/guanosine-3',5'-bis(diphosphate) 3'-pyrophosphohydrolase [Chiayiivirga flava]MBB5207050.1 GTP pyrophosphokinase [Chiayiivirga flava]